MKLFNVQFKPDVVRYIRILASRYRIADPDFVNDLVVAIRKNGSVLPVDKSTCAVIAKREAAKTKTSVGPIQVLLSRREFLLRQLISNKGTQNLLKQKTPVFKLVEQLLEVYRRTFLMMREAQCTTCQFYTQCDFGKQYASSVRDIRVVIDPDYSKKVHASCPLLPQIEAENQMVEAAQFRANLDPDALKVAGVNVDPKVLEDEQKQQSQLQTQVADKTVLNENPLDIDDPMDVSASNGAGKGVTPNMTSRVAGNAVPMPDPVIDKLSRESMHIYMLSLRLEALLDSERPNEYVPTPEMRPDSEDRAIKSVTEIPKVKLAEHLKEDDLFDRQAATKELQTVQHLHAQQKRQCLYVLLDVSPSMASALARNTQLLAYLTRFTMGSALTIALCRKIEREKGILFFRAFDTGVGNLFSSEVQGFNRIATHVASISCDGNGTEITNAVQRAVADITSPKVAPFIDKSEILLITDVEDDQFVNNPDLMQKLSGIVLNVLDVSGGAPKSKLFAVADNYLSVDPRSTNLKDIVRATGGTKKISKTK